MAVVVVFSFNKQLSKRIWHEWGSIHKTVYECKGEGGCVAVSNALDRGQHGKLCPLWDARAYRFAVRAIAWFHSNTSCTCDRNLLLRVIALSHMPHKHNPINSAIIGDNRLRRPGVCVGRHSQTMCMTRTYLGDYVTMTSYLYSVMYLNFCIVYGPLGST